MPADLSPVRPGNAERLSRMVQLATTADDGDEPFAAFEALLAAEYPRAARPARARARPPRFRPSSAASTTVKRMGW
jgi:acyl carrier protein phosphodiesterase